MAESPDIMMKLGAYAFALSSAAYQELTRATGYQWAEQPRIGGRPALQFVGHDAETIALRGIVYPGFRGGTGQLDTMRAQAARGVSLPLVSGTGAYLGRWVIERVGEGQTIFFSNGMARRVEFDLALKRYA